MNSTARCRRCSSADHGAVGDVERGEQAGDAVADVVVGAPLGHAGHHRQHRLGPVQGLDLALLIDAEHGRVLRRVVVQADDVDDLLHEQRVGGQLEPVGQVGLEVEVAPDPPDRRARQPRLLGHRRPRPVGGVGGLGLQRRHQHVLDLVQRDRGRPAGPVLVDQPVQTRLHEPATPLADRGLRDPHRRRDVLVRRTSSAHANTILARNASACADFARRDHRVSVARSSSDNTSSAFGRPRSAMYVSTSNEDHSPDTRSPHLYNELQARDTSGPWILRRRRAVDRIACDTRLPVLHVPCPGAHDRGGGGVQLHES